MSKAGLKRLLNIGLRCLAGLVILSLGAGLWLQYKFQDPAWQTFSRGMRPELNWQKKKYPSLSFFFDIAYTTLLEDPRRDYGFILGSPQKIDPLQLAFGPVGPKPSAIEKPVYYDLAGRPIPLDEAAFEAIPAWTNFPSPTPKLVGSEDELRSTLATAQAGDHILILPGTYHLKGRSIHLSSEGREDAPIFLRATSFGDVTLEMTMLEGFVIRGPYWVVENLVLRGACEKDSACEHAMHVVGKGRSLTVRNVMAVNFNAAMKINRLRDDFPDDGLVEASLFANEWPRQTSNPVTPIDLVAANNWVVTKSVFADFAKQGGNMVSYGAFYKGASEGGTFERNLVMCEWQHHGGVRVGLSFGGGGTYAGACRDGTCAFEHKGGTMRTNIIMNCPNDVGIYVNRAPDSAIYNNILARTHGIDVRFKETTASVFNNVLDGRIAIRDEAQLEASHNLASPWRAAFLASQTKVVYRSPYEGDFTPIAPGKLRRQGLPIGRSVLDFCGAPLQLDAPDIGAFRTDMAASCADLGNGAP